MRRAELVTALLMAALSIYLMVKSAELPIGWVPDEGPGGGSFPFWLSAAMLLSCLWILYNWYRRTSPPSQSDEPFMDSYAARSFALAGGGVTAMIALVHVVGMYGAVPLFLIFYIRFLGRHSWATSVSIAVGATVGAFFFFDVALRIVLPKGYLEPLFIPLYSIFL
ncbi:MAG: tripartite tricarboxylate transporter TctB family protein [Proteobacteria bacterium]|nr:tripartite tricarboxylate transporter TctB family protein [Pseudomonadota bacterium]MCK5495854.1 tripartite tricarboxylate transporter TctB family protein [Hyphomicrobiaceae bacterium]